MQAAMSANDPAQSEASRATAAANSCRVELKGISKSYGENEERQSVIHDLSLEILPGQLTVVVGPSGCGKSTLVNLLAGFEQTDSGDILFDGARIKGPSKERMVVFQESALIPWQTAYANVVFGPKLRGDLTGIVRARRLSAATMRNIRQNLFFAFIYNALGIPIAAGILYPSFGVLLSPIIAGAAMSLSSVSVIVNALRLRKSRLA